MKTNKEYPATHSMSTAWYCVDEDGNVGIFDIDDNISGFLKAIFPETEFDQDTEE